MDETPNFCSAILVAARSWSSQRGLPTISHDGRIAHALVLSVLVKSLLGTEPRCHRRVISMYIGVLAALSLADTSDPRDVLSGTLMSSFGDYQDQPQIVVTRNGTWSAVLTVNSAHEGQGSQRVMSTFSGDAGRT